nr:hypothetical protein [Tanacetum cinerariifolium]
GQPVWPSRSAREPGHCVLGPAAPRRGRPAVAPRPGLCPPAARHRTGRPGLPVAGRGPGSAGPGPRSLPPGPHWPGPARQCAVGRAPPSAGPAASAVRGRAPAQPTEGVNATQLAAASRSPPPAPVPVAGRRAAAGRGGGAGGLGHAGVAAAPQPGPAHAPK